MVYLLTSYCAEDESVFKYSSHRHAWLINCSDHVELPLESMFLGMIICQVLGGEGHLINDMMTKEKYSLTIAYV